jgi:apolipoprotein N-acyltransferase
MLAVFSSILALFYGAFCAALAAAAGKSRSGTFSNIFTAAALWVLMEWARGHVFTGFPWALLGYSQWKNVYAIQVCEYTSVYGVSFIIVAVNAVFAAMISEIPERKGRIYGHLIAVFLIVSANSTFGIFKILAEKNIKDENTVRFCVLQGNISQYMKWDEAYRQLIMDNYSGLVEQAAEFKPQVMVWPETALPGYLRYEKNIYLKIKELSEASGAYHIIGSPELESKKCYNSAFLVSPQGGILSRYDKVHLVPIGEYLPGKKILSRFFPVLSGLGDFTAGRDVSGLATPYGKMGVLICYEIIFPELTRKMVNCGARYLVNITNDAWYMETHALQQHFSMAVFRAVENRISVVRAANTGISGFINKYGGVEGTTRISEKTFLIMTVKARSRDTFYTRHGDVFILVVFLLAAAIIIKRGVPALS